MSNCKRRRCTPHPPPDHPTQGRPPSTPQPLLVNLEQAFELKKGVPEDPDIKPACACVAHCTHTHTLGQVKLATPFAGGQTSVPQHEAHRPPLFKPLSTKRTSEQTAAAHAPDSGTVQSGVTLDAERRSSMSGPGWYTSQQQPEALLRERALKEILSKSQKSNMPHVPIRIRTLSSPP